MKKREGSREIEKRDKREKGKCKSIKRENVLEREKGLDVEEERRFQRKIEKREKGWWGICFWKKIEKREQGKKLGRI